MKYVLVYYGGGMPSSPDEQAAVMKAWGDWYAVLGAAVVDAGNPFSAATKSITPDGKISDSPIARLATGYSILEADSLGSAANLAKGCPILKAGGQIAVYETFNAM